MKIGFSLSQCIKDIIDGKVNERDVYCIITATQAFYQQEWNRILTDYEKEVWNNNALGAVIADKMKREGRIVQPRCNDQPIVDISRGVWLDIFANSKY